MAASMSATLTGPATAISGAKFSLTLALIESGGAPTNLVSIQPYALNAQGTKPAPNVRFGTVANALTIANNTGAAVVLNASSTTYFNFECVIDGPSVPNAPAQGQSAYMIGATIQTSDGEVFSPVPIVVPLNQAMQSLQPNGQSQIVGTSVNAYSNVESPGLLRFDQGANSYGILF